MNKYILLKFTVLFVLINLSFSSFANNNKVLVAPVASFTSATITGINTTIILTDASTNTPTSWTWSFSPATITYQNSTTATSQNPEVSFTASGTYSVTLTATNADGSHGVTNKIYVVGTETAPYTGTFAGSVVTPFIFPPAGWAVVNPDAPAKGWEAVIVQSIANEPREVARIDNYSYSDKGQLDDLVLPMMDLSGLTNPVLSFNLAYAAYNSTNSERLYIQCSTDGGVTFTTTAYDKSYATLPTTTDQSNGWAPTGTADWRVETVNLLAFKSSQTIIKFVQENGYGNGLFIHDVKIIEASVLPVELTFFEGKQADLTNLLTWQTASEQNNKGFYIEKSLSGNDWKQIDFIAGNGRTTEVSNYQFKDDQPFNGKNYYRLKQIDFDEKYEYSSIIVIDNSNKTTSSIGYFYPNPSNNNNSKINIEVDNAQLSIIDNTGRIIKVYQPTRGVLEVNTTDLPSGVYYVNIVANHSTTVRKLIVN